MERWNQIIEWALETSCSEIHLVGEHVAVCRRDGVINFDSAQTPSHQDIEDLAGAILTEWEAEELRRRQSVLVARSIRSIRVRVLITNTARGLCLYLRLLPGQPPELSSLNLHPSLAEAAELKNGLVLICGPGGSGRTTSAISILEEINRTRPAHIITLENPIEYRLTSKRSFIQQREKLTHFPSFEQGLADALRESPEVIGIDEFNGPEMIRLALHAADGGCLVIAVVNAASAEEVLYRLQAWIEPELKSLIRALFASSLRLMVVQKLRYWPAAGFILPFLNIYRDTPSVKSAIRDNKGADLDKIAEANSDSGMFSDQTYEAYLKSLRDFVAPFEQFRPSEETAVEALFQTPRVGHLDPGLVIANSLSFGYQSDIPIIKDWGASRPGESPGDLSGNVPRYYVIDEKTTPKRVLNIFDRPSKMAATSEVSGRYIDGQHKRESEGTMNQSLETINSSGELNIEPPLADMVARIYETPEVLDRLLRYVATLVQLKKKE